MRKWVDDLAECWYLILAGFFIAVFIGVVYCYLLRCCAGPMTWIILITLNLFMYFGGWLSFDTARKYQNDIDAANTAATAAGTSADTDNMEWNRNWFYVGAGLSWLSALLFTCIICCNIKKIALIVAIIKASGRFVNDNLMILLVPVINTLIALALLVLWFVGVIYLYSVGTITQNTSYPWSNVAWESFTEGCFYFNLFFGLWVLAFMVSFNVFVIAAATVIWFFQQGKGQEAGAKSKRNPCCTGLCWASGYHMGSIAFGSFILAVIWLIQIIMAYIAKKVKDSVGGNCCVKCLLCYIQCCLACFERFIQFLNKQAYIQVALTNKNFCSSAKSAFVVIMAHMLDFSLLSWIGNAFMYIATLLIMGGSTVIIWLILSQTTWITSLSSIWFPLVLCLIQGYLIGKIFTSIYMTTCYAILQCFYVLSALNGAEAQKYAPTELKEFVEKAQSMK